MKSKSIIIVLIALWTLPQLSFSKNNSQLIKDSVKQENWQKKYKGWDVKGSHIIAFWDFDNKRSLGLDVSGNGNDVNNINKSISREGKFGSGLNTDISSLIVKKNLSLNLSSEFSIEMWINPLKKQADKVEIDLVNSINDKLNSINNIFSGYKLSLISDSIDSYHLYAELGFGTRYVYIKSNNFTLPNKTWGHVALTYDGNGKLGFYFNGRKIGEFYEEDVTGISPSNFDLIIGKKNKKNNENDLSLIIDEVRISNRALEYSPYKVEIISDRQTFVRMEKDASIKLKFSNIANVADNNITFNVGWGWGGLGLRFKYSELLKNIPTNGFDTDKTYEINIPINTKLRSDKYYITVDFTDNTSGEKFLLDYFPITIVDRKLPDEFPVVMWGPSWGSFGALDKIKEIGFTHALGIEADYEPIWKSGKPVAPGSSSHIRETRRHLDNALEKGITIIPHVRPAPELDSIDRFKRIKRDGSFYERSHLSGHSPEVLEFVNNAGVAFAKTYGDMPAFGGALIHTETRDLSQPSFQEIDKKLFRQYSGREIPTTVRFKRADSYKNIKGFPKDRVISDTDSMYVYFKWYWKEGDSWNKINSETHKGLKTISKSKADFWTFHDPAVRTGSVYGSGGLADVISHWTYTYPNPLKIGLTTDELLCMADGANHKQDVMSMTQIIWYRSQMAPAVADNRKLEPKTEAMWEKALPQIGRQYITISPAHLGQALWTKIARPITGIMYHGWQSLSPNQYHSSYLLTNDATALRLKSLVENVIKPLGPTLKSIPAIKSDVAFYESFAAQVYAARGTAGWAGTWLGDSYIMLNYAGLQPNVVYDETIQRDGLDGYKVLVMMDCDVITESVRDAIIAFQQRGGIVIGDKEITPSISPNITIERYERKGHSLVDDNQYLQRGEYLKKKLAELGYKYYINSSNPSVVPYLRRYATTDYVFLINDNREYGDYVGQHGLVMENGKPAFSKISIARSNGFAYDLVNHTMIENFKRENNTVDASISLSPGDGSLIMITDRKIDNIKIQGPEKLLPNVSVVYNVTVHDDEGKAIDAIIPLEVEIKDSEGRILEKSGYWKALGGKLEIPIDIAPNDARGIWQIKVKELASGKISYIYPRMGEEINIQEDFKDENKADSFQPFG